MGGHAEHAPTASFLGLGVRSSFLGRADRGGRETAALLLVSGTPCPPSEYLLVSFTRMRHSLGPQYHALSALVLGALLCCSAYPGGLGSNSLRAQKVGGLKVGGSNIELTFSMDALVGPSPDPAYRDLGQRALPCRFNGVLGRPSRRLCDLSAHQASCLASYSSAFAKVCLHGPGSCQGVPPGARLWHRYGFTGCGSGTGMMPLARARPGWPSRSPGLAQACVLYARARQLTTLSVAALTSIDIHPSMCEQRPDT